MILQQAKLYNFVFHQREAHAALKFILINLNFLDISGA